MDWFTDLLNILAGLPRPVVLAAAAGFAFSETALGFGVAIPGETGVLVLATTVRSWGDLVGMSVVIWLAAATGDSFGYGLGRRYGVRVRDTRLIRGSVRERYWDQATDLLRRRGTGAVLVARFLPVVRALMPVAAGSSRMGYPRFVLASLVGSLIWSVAHVAAGALAGASIQYVENIIGTIGWVVLGTLVAIVAIVYQRRRRRATAEQQQREVEDIHR